ncbi:hypothetical protein [Flavobacterium sp. 102]|uniref:hypothetical protein n=1 Tax=Flavobacterium sp. 102 TaxID=2135623 RepID=UPI000EB0395A|nr:hypothetical protein [Flavobacterium sp. 102]RKS02885.1 hypothetical protein C8C84_2615 [Flavobacterium sp. 102]
MKQTFSILILLFLGNINCFAQDTIAKIEKPIEVSIEELIKHSEKYEKKNISVYGYVKFDKQKISRIFISKEDFENKRINNSVCFMFLFENSSFNTVKRYDEKYVQLSGIYVPGKAIGSRRKLKMKNGVITEVRIKFPANDN